MSTYMYMRNMLYIYIEGIVRNHNFMTYDKNIIQILKAVFWK